MARSEPDPSTESVETTRSANERKPATPEDAADARRQWADDTRDTSTSSDTDSPS